MGHPSPRPILPFPPPPEPASSSGLRLKQLGVRTAGRYVLLDEIGSGGMASVHLARVDGPGGFQRWFAIKRIHPCFAADEQLVDMFLDEARTAARINHPNVVQVFEIGKDEESYWLAMEYLHGDPLRELLRRASERGAHVSGWWTTPAGTQAATVLRIGDRTWQFEPLGKLLTTSTR